ncbi:TRAP transporter large permease [Vibrio sp. S12_S33]|uniref:TRAP transporter large permease n=1 Tax=Vibrio sp. S12_S33 TaxID=2720223 RepID=UPI001782BBA7|nr:TRAP transporter large permease [Vibrio sp. S12_S33]MBD1566181.1 TRAP transporter large permease [Vibrio sp. S12_S33]
MNALLASLLIPFFLLGVPIAISIILVSIITLYFFTSIPLIALPQRMFVGLDSFPLMAIPFFILAGNIMSSGGISKNLVDFARSIVGRFQGGLAATCVLTCLLFAAVSGSSIATTFAIGSILIPSMVKQGYPKSMAAAIQASSAELGVLIPPSIPLILYGVSTDTSIGSLFLATLLPGGLIALCLIVCVLVMARVKGIGKRDAEGCPNVTIAFKSAISALIMPIIVLGGIYGGIFTPTEASAVAVIYSLLLTIFNGTFQLGDFFNILKKTAKSTTIVMLVISAASLFSFLISLSGMTEELVGIISNNIDSKLSFFIAINLFLFVVGMFVETAAAILILAPILAPLASFYGIDAIHFGIIMVVNLALGMFTPPLGVNLFAASQVAELPVEKMLKPLVPLVSTVIVCLCIITWFPSLSLWLPQLLK